MGRRAWLQQWGLLTAVFAGTVSAPAVLSGCARTEPLLRVALNDWPGYQALQVARAQGWLEGPDLRLVETPSSTVTLQMLAAGVVEAAALTLDELLAARVDRPDLVAVLIFDESRGGDALVARPGIAGLEQLVGQRIGVERSAVGALVLDAALRKAGLPISAVQPVYLTVDAHVQAWRSGRVDALVTFEPALRQVLASGATRLFDSRLMPGQIIDLLAVPRGVLQSHGAGLRRLLAAHFKALEHLQKQPREALAAITGKHQSLEQLQQSFEGLRLVDLDGNLALLSGDPPALQRSAEVLEQTLLKARLMERRVALSDLCDASFLPARS